MMFSDRFVLYYTIEAAALENQTSDIINVTGLTKLYVHGQGNGLWFTLLNLFMCVCMCVCACVCVCEGVCVWF